MRSRDSAEAKIFYIRIGNRVRGPFSAADLYNTAGFCGDTLVCPKQRSPKNRWNWAPAQTFPSLGFTATGGDKASPASPSASPRLSERAHRIWEDMRRLRMPVLPVAIGTAVIIFSVVVWMQFSFLPGVRETYLQAHTGMDLLALARLQGLYRQQKGVFADDFDTLADFAGDSRLPAALSRNLDLQTLLVRGTTAHFVLEANSFDRKRTLIRFEASASTKTR